MSTKVYILPEGMQLSHIIQGCLQAKRESQGDFYKMFYSFSMAICMRYSSTNEIAMEVVNDGFLKIFRQLHSFKPAHADLEASLKGWMKIIFIHTAIDHFRRNSKNQFSREINEEKEDYLSSEENSIDKLSYKEIIEIVQRLTPVYRTVFNLYVIDGYKHEDIAKKLHISVGTSKSNLSKAKINIQKMLKETGQNFYERKAV